MSREVSEKNLGIQIWVAGEKSGLEIQIHSAEERLPQQAITTTAVFLRRSIATTSVSGLSHYMPGTFTLCHLVLTKFL